MATMLGSGLPVAYLWPTYAGKVGHSVTRVKTAQKWTSGLVGLPFTAKVHVRVFHHYRARVYVFLKYVVEKVGLLGLLGHYAVLTRQKMDIKYRPTYGKR